MEDEETNNRKIYMTEKSELSDGQDSNPRTFWSSRRRHQPLSHRLHHHWAPLRGFGEDTRGSRFLGYFPRVFGDEARQLWDNVNIILLSVNFRNRSRADTERYLITGCKIYVYQTNVADVRATLRGLAKITLCCGYGILGYFPRGFCDMQLGYFSRFFPDIYILGSCD